MRVLQLIDSLEAGGAERMAVNYANALANKIVFSGLVTTRKEGVLKNQIDKKVTYLFLKRTKKIDFKAVIVLRRYIRDNKIDIIHAHSSSFFIAVLVKFTLPKIKIIWHDHYGTRPKQTKKENRILIFLSAFFSAIFVVNFQLEKWNKKNMNCHTVTFIPNFATSQSILNETKLTGIDGKRIVFLANLKNPKNHILILKAFKDLNLKNLGWTLHLIGKDYFDSYSKMLKNFIQSSSLHNDIYLYNSKSDIKYILSQASIGVLASTEEGFPVTLLEYGLENLAVLSTNVGYCEVIIENDFSGLLFDPNSVYEVKEQLIKLVTNVSLRNKLADNLKKSVDKNYSEQVVIEKLILSYKKHI